MVCHLEERIRVQHTTVVKENGSERVKDSRKGRPAKKPPDTERDHPRLWVSLMVIFILLVLMALGQWDFALAGFIGLIVGNGLATFTGR